MKLDNRGAYPLVITEDEIFYLRKLGAAAGNDGYITLAQARTIILTAGGVKIAYESNANTNAYTDAEKTKLGGIEAGADVTGAVNVAAAGALMKSGGTMTGDLTTAGVIESTDVSPVTVAANPEVLSITGKTILQRRLRTGLAEVFTMPTAASNNGRSFTLYLHQVLTGNPVATSATFTGVDWGIAGTFVVSNLNDKVDILTFACINNKWYGTAGKGFGL